MAGRTQQYPRPASAKHSTLWRCLRPESADFSQFMCHRNWQLQRLKRGRGNHQYKHASLNLKVNFVAINYVAKMLCLQPRYPVAEVMVEIIAINHSPIFCIESELSLRRVIMDVVNEEDFFLKLARREFEPSSASIIHKNYWLNLGTCRKICESIRPTLMLYSHAHSHSTTEATLPKLT